MDALAEKLRKDTGPGVLLSLFLHGLLLFVALWYVQNRSAVPTTSFKSLPVELVIGGSMEQGASSAPFPPEHPRQDARMKGDRVRASAGAACKSYSKSCAIL